MSLQSGGQAGKENVFPGQKGEYQESTSKHGASTWHLPVGAHPKPGSISPYPTLSRNELLRSCILYLAVCSHAANV